MEKAKCPACGSDLDKEHSALLLGKEPYKKECKCCGAELCPKCGHSREAHIQDYVNPLKNRCDITWDGAYCCECNYYGCDIDKEFKWNPIALASGTMKPVRKRRIIEGAFSPVNVRKIEEKIRKHIVKVDKH